MIYIHYVPRRNLLQDREQTIRVKIRVDGSDMTLPILLIETEEQPNMRRNFSFFFPIPLLCFLNPIPIRIKWSRKGPIKQRGDELFRKFPQLRKYNHPTSPLQRLFNYIFSSPPTLSSQLYTPKSRIYTSPIKHPPPQPSFPCISKTAQR